MCGRYYTDKEKDEMRAIAESIRNPEMAERMRYGEIRPSDTVPIVISTSLSAYAVAAVWGYGNDRGQTTLINARSETAAIRQTFSADLALRRCVVPCSGFFEWSPKKEKNLFFDDTGDLLYLGGLWRRDCTGLYRFVILTTSANTSVADIHDRMPVTLKKDEVRPWLYFREQAQDFMSREMPQLCRMAV